MALDFVRFSRNSQKQQKTLKKSLYVPLNALKKHVFRPQKTGLRKANYPEIL